MTDVITFLLHGEDIKLKAYKDSGGVWTIGIGNTFYEDGTRVKMGDTITKERAFKLAEFVVLDVSTHIKKCLTRPVNKNQFTALISFCYNVGKTHFQNSLLVKMINANPDDPAIRELFLKSFITVNGIYSKGLALNRRPSEANKYFSL